MNARAEIPDTIWTYDAQGNRLCGVPNYDKPGVFEAVQRAAFDDYCITHRPAGVLGMLIRAAEVRRFEEEMARANS